MIFLSNKRKDVVVLDKHLVRLDKPPKDTRPQKLIPVAGNKDKR